MKAPPTVPGASTSRECSRLVTCLAACRQCGGSHVFAVIVPVDQQFFGAVENRIAAGPSEVLPGPFHEGFDLGARRRQQGGVHADQGRESNSALEFMAMLTDLGHGGVPPDHCHNAFIKIAE